MKHTTEELILAAHVLTLAANIRNHRAPRNLSEEEDAKWLAANPAVKYVPDAMKHLEEVATTIASIKTQGQ